ncbi:hypothetical protein MoryE10_27200 [Methylogaea oryzae]|uniref:diguanylate cyclase n=2 Tax=Methylogaea oryzae TaxID=1295382 RepID=A0A8D4VRS8_9GAMM|nr:hypothetical protein MoryE10_27200 [Methylogaea oryzae]
MAGVLSRYRLETAGSGEQAIESVLRSPPDLILLDVRLPGMDGYETCRRLKRMDCAADIPIIFFTGLRDAEDEALGFALGAVDFISKPIRSAIVSARVQVHLELKAARDALQKIALSDGLTGIANRRHFETRAQAEWNRALRNGSPLSLIMVDVDHFKAYNDYYGHQAGDECLKSIAASLSAGVRRAADVVARFGGEEFVCLTPELSHDDAIALAQRLRMDIGRLSMPHARSETTGHVTASFGLATMAPDLVGCFVWQDLLTKADQALYQAKRAGRDRVVALEIPSGQGLMPRDSVFVPPQAQMSVPFRPT